MLRVASRSLQPRCAAQPVIRRLSGEGVLVLEDGQRTGDVASTPADHEVTIDPLTAERIEVVADRRGCSMGAMLWVE
jgi:iron complex outermembrane receptor protein